MYFLDSLGFFSLVCLLIQCGLAWTFLAFFGVLTPRDSISLRRWRTAFAGLAVALTALSLRFMWAQYHVVGDRLLAEGDPVVRLMYGTYLAGKFLFVWHLVGGVAALRDRWWPKAKWLPLAGSIVAFAAGFAMKQVEMLLIAQSPWIVVAYVYAFRCLKRRPEEVSETGRRLARGIFGLWAVAWVIYGCSVFDAGPLLRSESFTWNIVLQFNSLVDLTLQVALAASLIVVVMHDAQLEALAASKERDRLRERLQRDEKMRALSTLVGGVAHQINNPLTAILGFADELAISDPKVRGTAARIVREQAERCRNIVKRMAMFGRRPELTLADVDLANLLERIAVGFRPQLAQIGVALQLDIDTSPCRLRADVAALAQIVTNLVENAVEASPRGGRIVLTTRVAADALHLVVVDQGPGVPAADRARVFEPFWTTKTTGEGTGLGLPVAQVLAQAHGGRIEVGDAVGGGAQFELVLPLGGADDAAGAAKGRAVNSVRPVDANGNAAALGDGAELRVLVIDDEPAVRGTIARQAARYGWNVVPVSSGEQALELLLADATPFDAVVCDLRMPGLSGMALHDAIAKKAPWMLRRLLFVTGDLSSSEAAEFAQRCNAPIMTKPFAIGDLFERLREVVGGQAADPVVSGRAPRS